MADVHQQAIGGVKTGNPSAHPSSSQASSSSSVYLSSSGSGINSSINNGELQYIQLPPIHDLQRASSASQTVNSRPCYSRTPDVAGGVNDANGRTASMELRAANESAAHRLHQPQQPQVQAGYYPWPHYQLPASQMYTYNPFHSHQFPSHPSSYVIHGSEPLNGPPNFVLYANGSVQHHHVHQVNPNIAPQISQNEQHGARETAMPQTAHHGQPREASNALYNTTTEAQHYAASQQQAMHHDKNSMMAPSLKHSQQQQQAARKTQHNEITTMRNKEQHSQFSVSSSSSAHGTTRVDGSYDSSRDLNDQRFNNFHRQRNEAESGAPLQQQHYNETHPKSAELQVQLQVQAASDRQGRQFAHDQNLMSATFTTLKQVFPHHTATESAVAKQSRLETAPKTNAVQQMMLTDNQSAALMVVDVPTGGKACSQVSSLASANAFNNNYQQVMDSSILNNGTNVPQQQQYNLLDFSRQVYAEQIAAAAAGGLSPNDLMNLHFAHQYAPDSTNFNIYPQRQPNNNPTPVNLPAQSITENLTCLQPMQYGNIFHSTDPSSLSPEHAANVLAACNSLASSTSFSPHNNSNYSAATAAAAAANGGPIQLWQFLLEMLIDKSCQQFICWTGQDWEFKLIDPDEVAKRWGQRKNKSKMNYEKLSRGLRYYYDKKIIKKTTGKRYVYKFVCDLETMFGGIKPHELHQMVGIGPPQVVGNEGMMGEFGHLDPNLLSPINGAVPANASPSMASTASSSASSSSCHDLSTMNDNELDTQKRKLSTSGTATTSSPPTALRSASTKSSTAYQHAATIRYLPGVANTAKSATHSSVQEVGNSALATSSSSSSGNYQHLHYTQHQQMVAGLGDTY